jgi:putative ABC transport system permease protein
VPKNAFRNPTQDRDLISANARHLLAKVNSLPGVQSAALATLMPLEGNNSFPFTIAGHPVAETNQPAADYELVTPSYFDTFGVRLVQGRFLNDNDRADSPPVLMVNQSFVDHFLQNTDPLQQRLLLGKIIPNQKPGPATGWQIVGVFHDVTNREHLTDKASPQIFAPYWQVPWPYIGLAVRTALDPGLISRNVRDAVAETLPGYSLTQIQTMQHTLDEQLAVDRFGMILFGSFAVLALLLAALGIYGVMAFAVAQRNHEIGLRMALGAQQRDVVLLILMDGMKLALTGVALGLIGVYALGHLMRSTLYGIHTVDLGSFTLVAIALLFVAVIASYLPARRSAKVDPMIALRQN